MSPFTRDGHLTDLALDLARVDDLAGDTRAALDAHLAACPACEARASLAESVEAPPLSPALAALVARAADDSVGQATVESLPKPGLRLVAPPAPASRPRRTTWVAAIGLLAAAGLLFALVPRAVSPPGPDTFRAMGSGLALSVFRDEPTGSVRLQDGGTVRGGDRLGFQLSANQDGYALVLGVDSQGDTYACYPQAGAAAVALSGGTHTLPAAVVLDDSPGAERIVAVWCPTPFERDAVTQRLMPGNAAANAESADPAPPGCVSTDVRLEKAR